MAASNSARGQHVDLFDLWLTISLETDYRARGVFPDLRIERADRRSGTQLLFVVSIEVAEAVLKDAKERMQQIKSGRGVYQSYRALAARLKGAIDESAGVRPDPGKAVIVQQHQDIGCHPIGATLYDDDGDRVYIKGRYELRRVDVADGPFRGEDGMRFTYRHGYQGVCERSDGTQCVFFYPAGQLHDRDGYITHLRLVHSAT